MYFSSSPLLFLKVTFGTEATSYGGDGNLRKMRTENRAKMKNFVAGTGAFGGTSMEMGFKKVRDERSGFI